MNIKRYYICDACDYHFYTLQERDENLLKRCPKCRKHKLYQDLTGQHSYVYGEPTTLGHQADRNTQNMGKYELQDRRRKEKLDTLKQRRKPLVDKGILSPDNIDKEADPWFGKLEKKKEKEIIEDKTFQKAHKYIMEGN